MPKLSIITINYNNKAGLEKTIKSIITQSFKDFEFIVIDGASNDGSVDVIHQHQDKIAKWVSEKDLGIYNAMNKGIGFAKGEYCLFLNSGDSLYESNTLEKVFATEPKEDIVYGNMLIDFSGKKVLGEMPDTITFEHMMADTLWHPVSFIKRDLFAKYGNYREDLKIVSDYDFFIKAILVNKVSAKHIPVTISIFPTDGMSSQSSNAELIKAEREKVQSGYFSKFVIDEFNAKKKKTSNGIWSKLFAKLIKTK
ncbi:MAG TPA: glycosyltransferase family 2 protein [Bacteroidia bacterium]|nr:glycosyltransferase family 2 protein [Bacteroidia bacterium]